jgi:imidazolonepropionase-like amidohydrolase/ABC-type multidrug transport system permease subunit
VLRRPAYFVPVLILPVGFFLMFGIALAKQSGGAEATLSLYIGYGIFGVLAATVMGLAAAVATEREQGLLILKRALPLPPGAYLGAKVVTALAIAASVNLTLAVLAATLGQVQLMPQQWLGVFAINVLGGLPFAALGLFIGSRVGAAAAPGIANAVYLPLAFLGGLWIPLQFLPVIIRRIAEFTPSYHLLQLSLSVVSRGDGSAAWIHVAVLAAFAAVFFVLARQRLAYEGGSGSMKRPALRRLARLAAIAIAIAVAVQVASHKPVTATAADGPLTPADADSFAIRGVRVFDGERRLEHANVVVREGRIEAVGTEVKIPDDLPVVDGRDRTLLPGLIDAHVHAWSTARQDALRFGVTTELDMFGDWHQIAAAKQQRESLAKTSEADLWSAGTLATVPHGHGTEYGVPIPTLTTAAEAPAFVDARIAEGSDYIKIILEDGSAYGHSLPTLDTPTVTALVAAAHTRGRLAVAHVATQAEARQAIEAGVDGLAHVFIDQPADAAIVALAKAHRTFVVATLSVAATAARAGEGAKLAADAQLKPFLSSGQLDALRKTFPADWSRSVLLTNAIDSVRRLHAAGVPILAGTDAGNPGTTHGASLHQELALLVRAGLTPAEALTAATAAPAKLFGLKDRGWIVPGLRADLLLVSGDPTTDITATRAIVGIWKNGYWVDRHLPVGAQAGDERGGAAPDDPLIADFEDGAIAVKYGQNWSLTTDRIMQGQSTAAQRWQAGGADGSRGALAVSGSIAPGLPFAWAGTMFMPGGTAMQPVDFSSRKELVFKIRGDGREDAVMLFSGDANARIPSTARFRTTADWQEIRIPLTQFDGADLTRVRGLAITAGLPAGPFAFQIDDVTIR